MLYILPPPTNPSPPSVWDLIINFHRKGCQDGSEPSSPSTNVSKSIKFDKGQMSLVTGQKRSHRSTWSKSSKLSISQSHVRIVNTIDLNMLSESSSIGLGCFEYYFLVVSMGFKMKDYVVANVVR